MARRSAGIILYRMRAGAVEVLLVRPGGPYWRGRDVGAWQIPKGLARAGETACEAARRETAEELGVEICGTPIPLATIRQAGGKIVDAFVLEHEIDTDAVRSNTFEIEWPPGSGRRAEFPEIEAARWMTLQEAGAAMLPSQKPLLREVEDWLLARSA